MATNWRAVNPYPTTPEDDSGFESYKDEKTKSRIKAGKILLTIKTKEHADETDFDPNSLRKYQASLDSLKDGFSQPLKMKKSRFLTSTLSRATLTKSRTLTRT